MNCHLEDKSTVYCGCVVEDNHQNTVFDDSDLNFDILSRRLHVQEKYFSLELTSVGQWCDMKNCY